MITLQGFVWKALQKIVGDKLKKPTKYGFAVDGVIEAANLLIEIKTGTAAHFIYEAVGQLKLYPTLIGLQLSLSPILLIPESPMLKPIMAAALAKEGVEVYTYTIGSLGKKPKIAFSKKFLRRCVVE